VPVGLWVNLTESDDIAGTIHVGLRAFFVIWPRRVVGVYTSFRLIIQHLQMLVGMEEVVQVLDVLEHGREAANKTKVRHLISYEPETASAS